MHWFIYFVSSRFWLSVLFLSLFFYLFPFLFSRFLLLFFSVFFSFVVFCFLLFFFFPFLSFIGAIDFDVGFSWELDESLRLYIQHKFPDDHVCIGKLFRAPKKGQETRFIYSRFGSVHANSPIRIRCRRILYFVVRMCAYRASPRPDPELFRSGARAMISLAPETAASRVFVLF